IDTDAPRGVQLSYRVAAVDPDGTAGRESDSANISLDASEIASQQILSTPVAPRGLRVTSSHGRATLHWQHVDNSGGYLIERRVRDGGVFALAGLTDLETFTDAEAVAAGEYSYHVIALNGPVTGAPSAEA